MKDDNQNPRAIPEHITSTIELVEKFEATTNPVTKAVYRGMIETRIGTTDRQELIKWNRNYSLRAYLDKCTFSFPGRSRMENLFDLWFMK